MTVARPGWAGAAAALLVMLGLAGASAQNASSAQVGLAVTGRVAHPGTLDLAALQALSAVTVEVSHATSQGVQKNNFTGALLWAVVNAAAPANESGPRSHLQHTLLARGRDGYAVALAIGSKAVECSGFRNRVTKNSSEKGKCLDVCSGPHAPGIVRNLGYRECSTQPSCDCQIHCQLM